MAIKRHLFILSVILIFYCSTHTTFGISLVDNKSVQPNNYSNLEISNVNFDYYHEYFGIPSSGNTVIIRYGKIPVLDTMEQKNSWNSTLE